MGRGENFLGYSSKPDLVWLHLQCSGEGPYPLYQGDRSKLNIFDKQTCRRWKAMMEMERVKHPLRQRRRVVVIQPITHQNDLPLKRHGEGGLGVEPEEMGYRHTHISANVLELLRNFCAAYFSEMQVELAPPIDLSEITKLTSRVHKTTNRRQFLVDDIIHFLSTKKLRKAYCILGVTVVDLYPGAEWNFVLGQACMERGSGVFSFGRYFNNSMSTSSCERSGCGVKGESPPPGADSDGRETVEDEWEQQQIRNLWVLMRVSYIAICKFCVRNYVHPHTSPYGCQIFGDTIRCHPIWLKFYPAMQLLYTFTNFVTQYGTPSPLQTCRVSLQESIVRSDSKLHPIVCRTLFKKHE